VLLFLQIFFLKSNIFLSWLNLFWLIILLFLNIYIKPLGKLFGICSYICINS
jgi:hypothetical protein